MRRRDFLTLLGSGAAWPLAARAQQPAGKVARMLQQNADRVRTTSRDGWATPESHYQH
jgi:hypothetical protein